MTRPLILVSNDDGLHAAGIAALAKHVAALGDVWVVAPDRERSATSHSISLHKPLRLRDMGAQRFSVDGTPTDSVYMALHHILPRPPAIVLSGINHGPNLGNDVIYSGTVSAAMEGALFGHRAIAFSLCTGLDKTLPPAGQFEMAGEVAADIVAGVLQRPMPHGVLLNVNIPNVAREAIAGIKLCRLGYTTWTDKVDQRTDPRGREYYWIGGERCGDDDTPDSDNHAIAAKCVSVTPIHYDVTDFRSFGYVRDLPFNNLTPSTDNLGDQPVTQRRKRT
jgi:5'-nucleotidase